MLRPSSRLLPAEWRPLDCPFPVSWRIAAAIRWSFLRWANCRWAGRCPWRSGRSAGRIVWRSPLAIGFVAAGCRWNCRSARLVDWRYLAIALNGLPFLFCSDLAWIWAKIEYFWGFKIKVPVNFDKPKQLLNWQLSLFLLRVRTLVFRVYTKNFDRGEINWNISVFFVNFWVFFFVIFYGFFVFLAKNPKKKVNFCKTQKAISRRAPSCGGFLSFHQFFWVLQKGFFLWEFPWKIFGYCKTPRKKIYEGAWKFIKPQNFLKFHLKKIKKAKKFYGILRFFYFLNEILGNFTVL